MILFKDREFFLGYYAEIADKLVMKLYHRLVSASVDIKDAPTKAKAEILAGASLAKELLIVCMITTKLVIQSDGIAVLAVVALLNFAFYCAARSKRYVFAAYATIADPVMFLFFQALFNVKSLEETPQAAISLALGPVLASAVLSKKETALVALSNVLIFAFILCTVHSGARVIFVETGVMVIGVSLLAVTTSHLRERAEESVLIERANMFQVSKMAALAEMAGGIAHEINNPLAIIYGKAERIIQNCGETNFNHGKLKSDLAKIVTTSGRIATIVSGLRTIARDGKGDPLRQENLARMITSVLSLFEEKLKAKGINLELKVNSDLVIECRATEISQVILNLLSNSIDAIGEAPESWIKIQVQSYPLHVEISVADSGSGINAVNQDKIMSPFFTTKELGKGKGLGLSISKAVAESHGGSLKLDILSSNTRFIFLLPIAQTKNMAA